MSPKKVETFYPENRKQWRDWLQQNYEKKQSVWLIYYKKNSDKPSITWNNAVSEALCFGWIDSTKKSIDDESYMQYFSQRKAKSTWSKINKEKAQQLIDNDRMTKAGLESIKIAKQNGYWSILDEVEALIIPDDLEKAFQAKPGSKDFFLNLSKSVKKSILRWLLFAKRKKTRQKRIEEIAKSASRKLKPKRFRR